MERIAMMVALGMMALQAGSERFAGAWTAEFSGKTFVRLELTVTRGTLSGTISLGDIELDAKGDVKHAESAPPRATPIFEMTVRASTLAFSRKDGRDTDHFEMRLAGGAAELLFKPTAEDLKELAEGGLPAPKPILLKRK